MSQVPLCSSTTEVHRVKPKKYSMQLDFFFLALIYVKNPWRSCNEREIFKSPAPPYPQPWSFFHCPRRVGIELLFPWTRLELLLHQWVSVMNPLKPWADFGFPWVLLVPELFRYPVPQWRSGNSLINMDCACSEYVYHCDRKPRAMDYKRHVHLPDKSCTSLIIYEASRHASKFCKSHEVLVTWASSLQLHSRVLLRR